ncbi:copper-binding protein [Herbaspirillum sp. HC18]|nr:copper-binding protein [Herbaspirillum sp. HC18]
MKFTTPLLFVLALSAASLAIAQSDGMQGMDMKNMDMKHCQDMADMDMQKCQEMMKDQDMKGMEMGKPAQGKAAKTTTHQATAMVKAVEPAKGMVTLAHGPVKTLNWPAMTMDFKVKDKRLFDKLAMNKDVVVEFVQQGSDYVITSVK